MAESRKRAAPTSEGESREKKQKKKKQWQVPRRAAQYISSTVDPGDAGIWATCERSKEAKSVGELKDLFQEYSEKLYGDDTTVKRSGDDDDDGGIDIEAEIAQEVQDMQKPAKVPLFTNVKIDMPCVIFLKTRAPVDPVSFVESFCADALATGKKRSRFVKRLTPMSMMGKATENGLEVVAKAVVPLVFHGAENAGKKFAIRPTIRNHKSILNRDIIIRQVASYVGEGHKVDLKNPDHTILVDVYKNICGISIVGADYDKLKRFNLAEIYQPTPLSNDSAQPELVTEGIQDVDGSEGVDDTEVAAAIEDGKDSNGASLTKATAEVEDGDLVGTQAELPAS